MVIIASFFLILAVIVFLLVYKLKLKTRLLLAILVWIVPSIVVILFALLTRDNPSPNSYTWYSGPAHVNSASPSEQDYQKLIEVAKTFEQKGQLDEAINYYQHAFKVERIIVPSYYVLFDIGRLQYDLKQYEKARATLRSFLYNVDMELTYKEGKGVPEPPPGGFMVADQTKEHLDKLLADKINAEMLIKKIEEVQLK